MRGVTQPGPDIVRAVVLLPVELGVAAEAARVVGVPADVTPWGEGAAVLTGDVHAGARMGVVASGLEPGAAVLTIWLDRRQGADAVGVALAQHLRLVTEQVWAAELDDEAEDARTAAALADAFDVRDEEVSIRALLRRSEQPLFLLRELLGLLRLGPAAVDLLTDGPPAGALHVAGDGGASRFRRTWRATRAADRARRRRQADASVWVGWLLLAGWCVWQAVRLTHAGDGGGGIYYCGCAAASAAWALWRWWGLRRRDRSRRDANGPQTHERPRSSA